jgi:hypothetical protein
MSEVQEIIVYRNPLEQKIWHGIMDSDANIFLGILALCIVMFISVFILSKLQEKFFPHLHGDKGIGWVLLLSFILGTIACYFTL